MDSLVDVAAHLAAARQYIGNDSGVTHLAAAVRCPTIALFGPSNPAVWAPRGCRVLKFEEARSDLLKEILKDSPTRL
jgi:ADP-heptose:LPS heptosyltransferase